MPSNPVQRSEANGPTMGEDTLMFIVAPPAGPPLVDTPLGSLIEMLALFFIGRTVDRYAIRGILFTCAASAVGAPMRFHPSPGAASPSITIDPGDKFYLPVASLPDNFLVTQGAAECVITVFF